jgi:hypothetical protein
MSPSPSLAELQRWMRWALTHPLGVTRVVAGEQLAGLPERFAEPPARALAAVAGQQVAGRTAVERLSVHASGYFGRLHGTLEIEFPRLAAALGEGPFRSLVAAHLLRRPSTGPSLADLGKGLAETLSSGRRPRSGCPMHARLLPDGCSRRTRSGTRLVSPSPPRPGWSAWGGTSPTGHRTAGAPPTGRAGSWSGASRPALGASGSRMGRERFSTCSPAGRRSERRASSPGEPACPPRT